MNMDMGNAIYWDTKQVAVVYQADQLSPSAAPPDIAERVTSFRKQLNQKVLDVLNFNLLPLKASNVQQQDEVRAADETDSLDGVYLFGSPKPVDVDVDRTTVVVFYRIVPKSSKMTDAMSGGGSMHGNGGFNGMGTHDATDHTLAVVNHLNRDSTVLQALHVSRFDAMPSWFGASTDITHGCPISPPIPVHSPNLSGQWKTSLQLSDLSLQDKTGEGGTVFILDTLPTQEQIFEAARTAGNRNMLLQDMVEQINLGHIKLCLQNVPDPEQSAVTGKDIYGRLVGLPVVDHGLFIARIIHSLAPKANIECVRVLNDFGVGTLQTLISTLQHIHNRMSPENPETKQTGDLHLKPVVINLSLVVGPPESDLPRFGLDRLSVKPYLKGLKSVLQDLVQAGAVFVASAGNDTDPRDTYMNPAEVRFGRAGPAGSTGWED